MLHHKNTSLERKMIEILETFYFFISFCGAINTIQGFYVVWPNPKNILC